MGGFVDGEWVVVGGVYCGVVDEGIDVFVGVDGWFVDCGSYGVGVVV